MRSRTPPDLAGRCHACFFPTALCLCTAISPESTRTEVVIVRHAMERWKTSNTARWTLLALGRARLIEYGHPRSKGELWVEQAETWLVFPGAGAEQPPGPRPRRLVFIDGSWSQARHMAQRLEALRSLPRLSLPPPEAGVERLRRAPTEGHMSTLEAVSAALRLVGEAGTADRLTALHRLATARSLSLRRRLAEC